MAYKTNKSQKTIRQLSALAEEFDRMHGLNNAIKWYLERRPRLYSTCVDGANSFLWVTDQLAYGFPLLKILYQVDDDAKTVTILSVERIKKVDPYLQ